MIESTNASSPVNTLTQDRHVTVETRGDLQVLVLDGGPGGVTAEIALQGGQVLSWCPPGQDEVIFLSDEAELSPGTAVRGGIPVCFPWFGAGPSGAMKPSHGWARTSEWEVVGARREGEAFAVGLHLAGRDGSPDLALDLLLGATLEATATITGEPGAACELALHTYLGVGSAPDARVLGLDGATFHDKVTGGDAVQAGDVTFAGETDRVYLADGPLVLEDPALGRRVQVGREGFGCAVVWNPWAEKAAGVADLGDDEWRGFVCVEAAAVGERGVVLGDDGRWVGRMTLAVSELPGDEADGTTGRGAGAASAQSAGDAGASGAAEDGA